MDQAGVALYHRVMRQENFEKAAKDLVSLVYAAEKKEPGKPRTLYLDIDGHRNAQGRFDADMRSSKRYIIHIHHHRKQLMSVLFRV